MIVKFHRDVELSSGEVTMICSICRKRIIFDIGSLMSDFLQREDIVWLYNHISLNEIITNILTEPPDSNNSDMLSQLKDSVSLDPVTELQVIIFFDLIMEQLDALFYKQPDITNMEWVTFYRWLDKRTIMVELDHDC